MAGEESVTPLLRAICAFRGHRRGDDLFEYVKQPKSVMQHPKNRPAASFRLAGFICRRCDRVIAEEKP